MKTPFLALIAILTVGFLPVSQAENEVSAPVASTKPIFGVSPSECNQRINDVMNLRAAKGGGASDLLNYIPDEEIFGLKLSAWNDGAIDEFYHAFLRCTDSKGFIDDYTPIIKNKLPSYIAEKRENSVISAQLNKAAVSAGISLSCVDALNYNYSLKYQAKAENPGGFLPSDNLFGKDFIQYTDADYAFVRQKLSECANLIDSISAKIGSSFADNSKLTKLNADMAGWGAIQTKLIGEQNVANAAAEASQLKKTEEDRRTNNPTISERVAGYLKGVGTIGFLLSLAMVPRKDGRFKTGVKNNAKMPGWVWITFAVSIGMILLGGVMG